MTQLDLFGEKVEWHSEKWKQHQGEKVGTFPCLIAQQLPVGEMRRKHIENCDECKKLEREIDRSIGVTEHVYS